MLIKQYSVCFLLIVAFLNASLTYGQKGGKGGGDTGGGDQGSYLYAIDADYYVYPNAPGNSHQYASIQKAIDAAVAAGYTKDSRKIAHVFISDSEFAYTGDGPENEIYLPSSVRLHGMYHGSTGTGPKINATIILDNTGSLPQQSISDGQYILWQFSGLTFFQPHPDKPAIKFDLDLNGNYIAPSFSDCVFISDQPQATAEMLQFSNFQIVVIDRCWSILGSPKAFIRAKDTVIVDYINSVFIGYKFIVHEGLGVVIPGTSLYIKNCDFAIETGFIGNYDFDIVLFDILSPGIENIFIFDSDFLQTPRLSTTKDNIIFRAAATIDNSTNIIVDSNTVLWSENGGTENYIYYAPSATISTGGNAAKIGTTTSYVAGNIEQMILF